MKHLAVSWVLLFCLLLGSLGASPARACAGHTIVIGSTGSLQQNIVTQILSLLIAQRTGTSMQVHRFSTQHNLLSAAERSEIDLWVVDNLPASEKKLKQFNAVVLDPFGCNKEMTVPVLQLATVKKFPALKRLISRLNGIIDDAALKRLSVEAASSNPRSVAMAFLLEKKLIFSGL